MLCDNLEGWEGERGGRFKREETYVYLRLIHADVWQKPTQYCKAIILQLKISKFKKILVKCACVVIMEKCLKKIKAEELPSWSSG